MRARTLATQCTHWCVLFVPMLVYTTSALSTHLHTLPDWHNDHETSVLYHSDRTDHGDSVVMYDAVTQNVHTNVLHRSLPTPVAAYNLPTYLISAEDCSVLHSHDVRFTTHLSPGAVWNVAYDADAHAARASVTLQGMQHLKCKCTTQRPNGLHKLTGARHVKSCSPFANLVHTSLADHIKYCTQISRTISRTLIIALPVRSRKLVELLTHAHKTNGACAHVLRRIYASKSAVPTAVEKFAHVHTTGQLLSTAQTVLVSLLSAVRIAAFASSAVHNSTTVPTCWPEYDTDVHRLVEARHIVLTPNYVNSSRVLQTAARAVLVTAECLVAVIKKTHLFGKCHAQLAQLYVTHQTRLEYTNRTLHAGNVLQTHALPSHGLKDSTHATHGLRRWLQQETKQLRQTQSLADTNALLWQMIQHCRNVAETTLVAIMHELDNALQWRGLVAEQCDVLCKPATMCYAPLA